MCIKCFTWVQCIGLVALLSCGGQAKRKHDLMHDITAYNEGIRWQIPAQAAVRIPPKEREAFMDEREQLEKELRIDDFEMTRFSIHGETQNSADVQIRWTWHLDAKGIVRTTTSEQHWERVGARWLMVEESHVRGDRMPGMNSAEIQESEKDEAPKENEVLNSRSQAKSRKRAKSEIAETLRKAAKRTKIPSE